MLNDYIKNLNTEGEVRQYASVNGFDAGGLAKLLKAWNQYKAEVDTSLDDMIEDDE